MLNLKSFFDSFTICTPILLIVIGILGNSIIFAVFRFSEKFKYLSCSVFFSFMSITDTIALFLWNLDHFTEPLFNFSIERSNQFMSRLGPFYQFVSLQSSAFLLSVMTIDRYFTVAQRPGSVFNKFPFGTTNSALYWSCGTILVIMLLNSHLLFMPRLYQSITSFSNQSIDSSIQYISFVYITGFNIYPTWETIHLVLYSIFPFFVMSIFNGLLIKNVLWIYIANHKKTIRSNSKALRRKQMITVTLIFISLNHLITTLPASIVFIFLYNYITSVFEIQVAQDFFTLMDDLSFTNHSFRIFLLMLTNSCFRHVVFEFLERFIRRFLHFKTHVQDNLEICQNL